MGKKESKDIKKTKKRKSPSAGSNQRYLRWQKLDNTALIFPAIAGESMTNVYRLSITLDEPIRRDVLQEALDRVLPKFDGFNVRMRNGFFWNYFEENGKRAPRVTEEELYPCRFISPNKNNNYLFRVTYYKERINLEVFHVLADGMGGMNFLRELTYEYLRLLYPELMEKMGDDLHCETSLSVEDSFLENYRTAKKSGFEKKKAYLIKQDNLPEGAFGVMHGYMPIDQLKTAAHNREVSLNEYLVANFIFSVYEEEMHSLKGKRPIRVAVPVNLRPYFDSDTTRNFFIMVSAEFYPTSDNMQFADVLTVVKESLRSQIVKEHMEDLFSYSVSNQENKGLQLVPLVLKLPLMRLVFDRSAVANTSTVTNIGAFQVDPAYRDHIRKFSAFLAMSKGQSLKGTISSYQDTLCFTFSSVFRETRIQKNFFRRLAAEGVSVSLETNHVYY